MEERDRTLVHGNLSCRNQHQGCPIEGMESVVATVSGYHGSERFNLIKMISYAGASYVGAMSRSITHLVCWKFEGRKFDLAKKFKTIIVNHRWLEDCIKQGKRVPEGPYVLQSGQSSGPLLMEVPPAVTGSLSTKKYKALSERLHIRENVEQQIINGGCSSGDATWRNSCLLNKNLLSDFEKNDTTYLKSKHKLRKKISVQEQLNSSNRHPFQEPPLTGLIAVERGNSSSLVGDRRKGENGNANTTVKSSRKRRLVKMNANRNHNESEVQSFDPDCYHIGGSSHCNTVIVPSSHLDDETDIEVVAVRVTSDRDQLHEQMGLASDSFNGIEACDNQSVLEDTNLPVENAPRILMTTSGNEFSNIDASEEKIEDQIIEPDASLPTSTELSCVICWTDFSSTRGVLPCGHRFCFSCIQSWADQMASRRKISTCPLCKASFLSITKVEDAATSDQKIYSQTIPCGPSLLDIFILPDQEILNNGGQSSLEPVCSACRCREPEDLLMSCHLCQIRHIHSYCLDPPLLPWTCIHCKDLQTLYHRFH